MAVTRIWSIKGYVGDVISYAANKDKTDLKNFSEKSVYEKEKVLEI